MTATTQESTQWEHDKYAKSKDSVCRMRVSMQGQDAVKDEREVLLPNPCYNPKEAQKQCAINRYNQFISLAEYDNVPSNTLTTLLGAMFRIEPVIQLPANLNYLLEDADGNGNGLSQSMELTASECLQMRFHGLLVEYSSLAGLDVTELTPAKLKENNIRASIKHYDRESIVNWSFAIIKGVKKLNMVLIQQKEQQIFTVETVKDSGFTKSESLSYLMLALDANGLYYQKKIVISGGDDGGSEWGDAFYPKAAGKLISEIPFEIVFSTERKTGDIPIQLGYLDPISIKSLHRYKISALLNEALRITAQPTSVTEGWTEQSFTLYKKMTGEEQVNLGSTNHISLPEGAKAYYLEWNADTNGLFKAMENNQKEIVALGGNFDDLSDKEGTATAAAINSAEKKAVLSNLAKNEEQSYKRVVDWIGMFNGVDTSKVIIKISREFVSIKLTAQEVQAVLQGFDAGAYGMAEVRRQLKRGGFLAGEVDQIIEEMQTDGEK